jgi:hypothetical protein
LRPSLSQNTSTGPTSWSRRVGVVTGNTHPTGHHHQSSQGQNTTSARSPNTSHHQVDPSSHHTSSTFAFGSYAAPPPAPLQETHPSNSNHSSSHSYPPPHTTTSPSQTSSNQHPHTHTQPMQVNSGPYSDELSFQSNSYAGSYESSFSSAASASPWTSQSTLPIPEGYPVHPHHPGYPFFAMNMTSSKIEEPILAPGEEPAPRPPISYAALIGEALLLAQPPHQLYVSEISDSIKKRYPCESSLVQPTQFPGIVSTFTIYFHLALHPYLISATVPHPSTCLPPLLVSLDTTQSFPIFTSFGATLHR